jgi:hypothetical protein
MARVQKFTVILADLLSKLEFYGVKGKAKLRFDSHFRNRYQRVLITNNDLDQNDFSTWEEMKHGVLQGSSLDPLLFLLFINDLPRTITIKPYQYCLQMLLVY